MPPSAGPKPITIVVNAEEHEVERNAELSHAEVAKLAFPNHDPLYIFSITFERGRGNKPEGVLAKGETVKVKKGMEFRVTQTGKS